MGQFHTRLNPTVWSLLRPGSGGDDDQHSDDDEAGDDYSNTDVEDRRAGTNGVGGCNDSETPNQWDTETGYRYLNFESSRRRWHQRHFGTLPDDCLPDDCLPDNRQLGRKKRYRSSGGRRNQGGNGAAPTSSRRSTDVGLLPPELGVMILSYLNATDLCLAGCVWDSLGRDEFLWQGLCLRDWGHCFVYSRIKKDVTTDCADTEQGELSPPVINSYRKLYLLLDEGTLTFNSNWKEGMDYFLSHGLVTEDPGDVARLVYHSSKFNIRSQQLLMENRRDVADELLSLLNLRGKFLPTALRSLFYRISAPSSIRRSDPYLSHLLRKFSERFCLCNADLELSPDAVFVACFSLFLLSADLGSPHVRNKMSKREFIKNTLRASNDLDPEFVGHLYDNIYLVGHVAPNPTRLCG